MKQNFLLASVALAFASGAAIAQDTGEQTIEISAIPQPVMAAAEEAESGMDFTEANTETEGGKTIYEIRGKDSAGMTVEVDVSEDGTVEEIERQIAADKVPANVMAALRMEVPNFQPTLIETSERDGAVTTYEFEGTADGKTWDVEVSADGSDVEAAEAAG